MTSAPSRAARRAERKVDNVFAAVITGKSEVQIRDVPEPEPTADGVVVDITYCGICGTDIHAYQSGRAYNPAVCGHEWTGHLSAIGREVRGWHEGDRVVVAVPPACGRCSACRAGHTEHCQTVFAAATGRDILNPLHGGFAARLGVPAGRVVAANAELTDLQAGQVEPATITFHAVRRSGLRLGDTAVIQGAGPIGMTTMQWVRARGAGNVIVVEPNAVRRDLALVLGASSAVHPDDAQGWVLEHTKGLGADVVYECVGRGFAVQTAVDLARRGGELCMIGFPDTNAEITPAVWLVKELRTVAALAYTHDDFDLAMGMIADGRVKLDPMHTLTIGLDGFEAAIADLATGASSQMKVLVDPR